jgi:mannose-6-phosphate isomerase-like protein (cupin superfamily)
MFDAVFQRNAGQPGCRCRENVMHFEAFTRRGAMRLQGVWLVISITLTAEMQTQNLPMPGKPSEDLASTRVFDYASLPVTHNPNGGERRDVVLSGRLATAEPVHIHESMQPPGALPGPAHTIEHSEFILVTEGTLEITHDGRTERAGPGSVIYVAYGTLHQARNIGPGPVKYTVIAIGGNAK